MGLADNTKSLSETTPTGFRTSGWGGSQSLSDHCAMTVVMSCS